MTSDPRDAGRSGSAYCFKTVIFVVSTSTPALCRAFVKSSEVMNPSTTSIEGVSMTRWRTFSFSASTPQTRQPPPAASICGMASFSNHVLKTSSPSVISSCMRKIMVTPFLGAVVRNTIGMNSCFRRIRMSPTVKEELGQYRNAPLITRRGAAMEE